MINISIVSYTNTLPFLYGLRKSRLSKKINLSLDYPSICAEKLLSNKIDIGLVPTAILNHSKNIRIVSDYCISANGPVDTVCIFSEAPIEEIKFIYLDYQSKTSIALLKILLKEYWKVSPELLFSKPDYEKEIKKDIAGLVIGDRAFTLKNKFPFVYDLSYSWNDFTGLPFVFATWMANKSIKNNFLKEFNDSLFFGISNISSAIKEYQGEFKRKVISDYLNNKISYNLTDQNKKGMDLFLNKLSHLTFKV